MNRYATVGAAVLLGMGTSVHANKPTDDPQPLLLIVSPEHFMPVAQEYAAARRSEIATECASLEQLVRENQGADDAERLKRGLYNRWRDSKSGRALKYVLLVGDADVMPVRYMVLDRVTPAAFDYAFYPSDLYYADLAHTDGSFDDWNANKEGFHAGYFGEVRGEKNKTDPMNFDRIDYLPEIAVGRWPASTIEEVRTIAAKTLAHERPTASRSEAPGAPPSVPHSPVMSSDPAPRTPPGMSDVHRAPALPRIGLVATGGWIENRGAMDSFAERLGQRFGATKLYWKADGHADQGAPDEAHVIDLLNDGVSLVLHSGHGSDDRWDGSIGVRSIGKFHNEGHAAIMMSAGCSTARLAALPPYEAYVDVNAVEHRGTDAGEKFDAPPPPPACYQRGRFNTTGLGEQLLRASPAGAVAYIGCDTGSQPCGMTLMAGFVERLAAGDERLGDCWVGAVRYYWEHEHLAELKPDEGWYPPSIFFQGMKFVVFGDPSVRVGE